MNGRNSTLALIAMTFLLVATAASGSHDPPWLDPSWGYRVSVTAVGDSIAGTEPLLEFPMLVALQSSQNQLVFQRAKTDGTDIIVTKSDGVTVLSREIAEYEPIAETAEIWVRVDSLSASQNSFYIYYGNPDTTIVAPPADAWKSQYRAVYHFADDPGQGELSDSSPNGASITLSPSRGWTSGDVNVGQIGQAWRFNGTTHHLSTRSISTQDSSYSVSAWLEHEDRSTDFFIQANPGYWHLSSQVGAASNYPDFARSGAAAAWPPNPIPINGGYHHFTWVFDGEADSIIFYFDGRPQPVVGTYPDDLDPIYTGIPLNPDESNPVGVLGPLYYNSLDLMTGSGDEFRVHEGALSGDWIATEYRNQADSSGFLSFGFEESVGATSVRPSQTTAGIVTSVEPNPFDSNTTVRFHLRGPGQTRAEVYDVAGRRVALLMDRYLAAGPHVIQWDGRLPFGGRAASGIYFLRISNGRQTSATKIVNLRR